MIGRELGLPERNLETLLLVSTLGDVGLANVPDSFYLKTGDLTRRAQSEMKKHPIYSRKIAGHIFGADHRVTRIVGEHHERLDGNGYPEGKSKEQLAALSLLTTGVDVYTAMIEERPHRSASLPDEALNVIKDKEDELSRKVVRSIEGLIGYYPDGSVVKLTNGTLAFVKGQNKDSPREPVVYVLTDTERNRLDSPNRLDLSESGTPAVSLLLRT
jgi:HD-GYP domain-containing protein (c-di-GMP phosphodiesterase class II)